MVCVRFVASHVRTKRVWLMPARMVPAEACVPFPHVDYDPRRNADASFVQRRAHTLSMDPSDVTLNARAGDLS